MFKRFFTLFIIFSSILSYYQPVYAQDFSINQLPVPGTMIGETAPFLPLTLKGLVINIHKPLEFQFIVDTGHGPQDTSAVKEQSNQLVKYFLAGLTIPEGDLWVNLSPYENNRIVPEALGQTDLGRDLLAQDYILKQITASLIYPEKDLGKKFWSKVYAKAQQQYGTTNIPVNSYNKVWILPDQAQVFEHGAAAYVTKATLKVMLDEDYLAKQKHQQTQASSISSQIVREIVIPEITKEVNTGKNFGTLRQIYDAMILAKWYKETIQNGLLDTIYTNKMKVVGVNLSDPTVKEQIYNRYLQAYKKGVFNYIKEDSIPDGQVIPRKYFSGGTELMIPNLKIDDAMSAVETDGAMATFYVKLTSDAAMNDMESFARMSTAVRSVFHGAKIMILDYLTGVLVNTSVNSLKMRINKKQLPELSVTEENLKNLLEVYNVFGLFERDKSLTQQRKYLTMGIKAMETTLDAINEIQSKVVAYMESNKDKLSKDSLKEDYENISQSFQVFMDDCNISKEFIQSRLDIVKGSSGEGEFTVSELFNHFTKKMGPRGKNDDVVMMTGFRMNPEVENIPIKGNFYSLLNAVYNLMVNGAESVGYRRNKPVEVDFSKSPEGGVQITVTDNGPGISAEMLEIDKETGLPVLFNFNASEKTKGAGAAKKIRGLGTYEARIVVKDMGGEISAKNIIGEDGNVHGQFTINLPKAQVVQTSVDGQGSVQVADGAMKADLAMTTHEYIKRKKEDVIKALNSADGLRAAGIVLTSPYDGWSQEEITLAQERVRANFSYSDNHIAYGIVLTSRRGEWNEQDLRWATGYVRGKLIWPNYKAEKMEASQNVINSRRGEWSKEEITKAREEVTGFFKTRNFDYYLTNSINAAKSILVSPLEWDKEDIKSAKQAIMDVVNRTGYIEDFYNENAYQVMLMSRQGVWTEQELSRGIVDVVSRRWHHYTSDVLNDAEAILAISQQGELFSMVFDTLNGEAERRANLEIAEIKRRNGIPQVGGEHQKQESIRPNPEEVSSGDAGVVLLKSRQFRINDWEQVAGASKSNYWVANLNTGDVQNDLWGDIPEFIGVKKAQMVYWAARDGSKQPLFLMIDSSSKNTTYTFWADPKTFDPTVLQKETPANLQGLSLLQQDFLAGEMARSNRQELTEMHSYSVLGYVTKHVGTEETLKIDLETEDSAQISQGRNDKAALANFTRGGIDLNQINVNRKGKTITVQFDQAQLNQLEQNNFEGFAPVITGFQYIQSPFPLLGINVVKAPEALAKV